MNWKIVQDGEIEELVRITPGGQVYIAPKVREIVKALANAVARLPDIPTDPRTGGEG